MSRWVPTFDEVVSTQLTRTEIAHVLVDPELDLEQRRTAVIGHFIRVLIETAPQDENYRAFTIKGLIPSSEYAGFSADASISTNLHLELNLPPNVRGANTVAFQLNCVSNSRVSAQEYELWVEDVHDYPGDVLGSTLQERSGLDQRARDLVAKRQRSRTQGPREPRAPARSATAQSRAANGGDAAARPPAFETTLHGGANLGVTMRADAQNPDAAAPAASAAPVQVNRPRGDAQVPPTLDRVGWKRLIIEDMRETNAVFARPGPHVKLSALRVQERDLEEYAQKLREAMDGRRNVCVCCMTAAPSIITLPCKHKVLCRYCAAKMRQCPVCRETAVEVFEPEDL